MTEMLLRPPLSRFAAIAILFLLVALLFMLVVLPVQQAFERRNQEIQQSLDLLERFGGQDLETASLEQRRDLLKREAQGGANLLRGASPSVAAASLQQFIRSTVQAERGTLRSVQILPAKPEAGYQRVTVRSQVELNGTGLRNLLHRIESSRPLLFVDNIDIRPGQQVANQAQGETEMRLTLRFDIHGFVRDAEEAGG